MTCAKCGATSRGDARFCGVCGAATSSTEPASNPSLGEAPQLIGREIAGRYRVLAKLGEGGMGAVYRAEQISLKRAVAVKILRPEVLGNELLLRRFNAEAEAVAKLSHPNTVNIYDFGQDADGTLFIAMEYIEGRSLRSVIHREAPLSPRRALAIAHQVAASLADAHAHAIVHRDLKPDNVMLQDRGRDHDIARVLDFGIAKLRDDNRATQMQMTQQGDMLGTPQYMAPEQIRAEAIDGRTDIYALGCLLYEMVTARMPHDAPTVLAMLSKHLIEHPVPPSQRRPDLALPPALDALILGAMAKDPAARPATMEVVGEQIAALLAQQPPDPRARGPMLGPAAVAPTMAPSHAGPGSQPGHFGHAVSVAGPVPFETPPAHSAFAPPVTPGAPGFTPPMPPMLPGPPRAETGPLPAPPAKRRLAVIVIAGVLIAAMAATALVVSLRPHGPIDEPIPTPAPPPGPAPVPPDPWHTSTVHGNKVGVGQGVSIIIPPEFAAATRGALTYAVEPSGLAIFAGPMEVKSDDPMDIARYHARVNKLTFTGMRSITIGGVQRPMLYFDGVLNNVPIRQIAVPLIGPSFRIAVIYQAPSQRLDTDNAVQRQVLDVFTQRIVLP